MLRFIFVGFLLFCTLWANPIVLQKSKKGNVWDMVIDFQTPLDVKKIDIKDDKKNLKFSKENIIPKRAIYMLIDSSVPMKKAFKKGIKPLLKDISNLLAQNDLLEIATFDADVNIVFHFGDDKNLLDTTLNSIKIKGQRTELMRASMVAIDELNTQQVQQKILVIASDGDFEDRTYSYKDVIKKAKKYDIKILSLGYRDSINLQSIRRLAEENNGRIWIADKKTDKMPKDFLNTFKSYLDTAILLHVDAKQLKPNKKAKVTLDLRFTLDNGKELNTTVVLPVERLVIKPKAKHTFKAPPPPKKKYTYWYVAGGGLIFLLLLWLMFKKKKENPAKKVRAYFETTSGQRFLVKENQANIGALDDNDIVIEGSMISRHHAVLDIKDDEFILIDRNSTNGISINGESVLQVSLKDGDKVSFGMFETTFKIVN
jgi:hypothetical protein